MGDLKIFWHAAQPQLIYAFAAIDGVVASGQHNAVIARARVDQIITRAAVDPIVAITRAERIRRSAAKECIIMAAADDFFDIAHHMPKLKRSFQRGIRQGFI